MTQREVSMSVYLISSLSTELRVHEHFRRHCNVHVATKDILKLTTGNTVFINKSDKIVTDFTLSRVHVPTWQHS
jgi:hypothetical protein